MVGTVTGCMPENASLSSMITPYEEDSGMPAAFCAPQMTQLLPPA